MVRLHVKCSGISVKGNKRMGLKVSSKGAAITMLLDAFVYISFLYVT
jgi:hypothetical protein